MIESMHIENFKCFKSFDIELGKFNVLIGPNDSGKTAFLQAVQIIGSLPPPGALVASDLLGGIGMPVGPELVWRQDRRLHVKIEGRASGKSAPRVFQVVSQDGQMYEANVLGKPGSGGDTGDWRIEAFRDCIGFAVMLRFDPSDLRAPTGSGERLGPSGKGLASYLLAFSGVPGGHATLAEVRSRLQEKFPLYKEILTPIVDGACRLRFGTVHGEVISADHISDGVLLSLAFLAIAYQPGPPRILLVEEPENGVHHAGLKDIVETLKHLSEEKGVQVIATTHSPYLLDLVEPEEVRVFAKDEEGAVHAAKLSDYPEVEKLRKHFMTGELWTEFDEADIVKAKAGGCK